MTVTAQRPLERVKVAVTVVFLVHGLAVASWVARLPAIRDTLGLTAGRIGLLLLAVSAGTVLALPVSGVVVGRVGPGRTVMTGIGIVSAGLLTLALGLRTAAVPLVAVALLVFGVGISLWDVAMNVEGADVERRLGRTLMPRFHAGFSFGTVIGALIGAGCARAGVPLQAQLTVTVAGVLVAGPLAVRAFQPVRPSGPGQATGSVRAAWREPRTLLIGLLVMSFALCEGVANDWIALSLVDGYGADEAVGAVGFGAFVTAMTLGRLVGGSFVERYGRVATLRTTGVLGAAGVLAVVASPGLAGALAGAVLWGLGASLGFPLGMSAAGDEEDRSAARVSVVSSIGYAAFLGGPPLVGLLADAVEVHRAILVALVAALVGLLIAPAARPKAAVS